MNTQMRILSTMALALLMAGCPSETVGPPPEPPVNWQSLEAGVRQSSSPAGPTANERAVAEANVAPLGAPEVAGLATRLDDDARFSFPGPSDSHGREAIVRAHDKILGAFVPRKIRTRRVWRTSSEQTVEWELTGIQTRDWMGVKASQKSVTISGVTLLWTKDDGAITDLHLYFDVAAVKAQLGPGTEAPVSAAAQAAGSSAFDATASGPPEVFEQESSPAERSNVAIAKGSLDALENNDLAAYEAGMANVVEIQRPGRAQLVRGTAGATSYFKAMHKAISQLDTTVTDAWGIGNFVVLEYAIGGEQLAPIDGISAQRDKTVVFHIVDIVEIAVSKMAHIWRYDNPSEIAVTPPS